MPADESKSPLILEFEEFLRKFEAAVRLTRSDFRGEATKVLDAARDQRAGMKRALPYFLDTLLRGLMGFAGKNFKPIAAIARRSSSANLLSGNHLFQEVLHGAPYYITAREGEDQDPLALLCELYESPRSAASFNEQFRLAFGDLWIRLVCEAELNIDEAPSKPSAQTPTFQGPQSRALASESAGAVDEVESAADRRRRTEQIGDRVVSRQPPQSRSPGAPAQGEEVREEVQRTTLASMLRRIQSSPERALQILIEYVKTANPNEKGTKAILKASDAVISALSEGERARVRPRVHDAVPDGWKDGIGEQPTLVEYWNRRLPDGAERRAISTYVFKVTIRVQ